MSMQSRPPFIRYLDNAREGRLGIGLLVTGCVVTVLICFIAQFFIVAFASLFFSLVEGEGSGEEAVLTTADLLATPSGMFIMLASIGTIWIGVWLALARLQKRPPASVLGVNGRITRDHFVRGTLAALFASFIAEFAAYVVDPSLAPGDIGFGTWLVWLLPFVVILLVQTSAEEVLFRGYIMQILGARFTNPWIWAGIPTLIFTLLHWDAEATGWMNAALLANIAAFAAVTVIAVVITGDLGAAMGMHFGANLFAFLIVSHQGVSNSVALFQARSFEAPDWTVSDAISFGAIGVASIAGTLWLLVDPRSPLRLR
ncbi:MAG: CPBP family intramembrane metalloprotease [Chelatococcus sp.]|nr:CPBP family intramembrane metalloprotease [Chelatococcus sp. YT9]MBX3556460.1 CPBP family intramembrane metalloprotease [Chelatococcus sp.]